MDLTRSNSDSDSGIISIDGPAGAGKSTIAKRVAEKLGFSYLDTGAMYRVVTLKALRDKVSFSDEAGLCECARNVKIRFLPGTSDGGESVFLHDVNVTQDIRSPDVSRMVSIVAKIPDVRKCMTELQRRIGAKGKWVVDGRDIGSVVFPSASVKIFLTASIEERARRRLIDLKKQGFEATLQELVKEIESRDKIDSQREVAPLKLPEGATILDTTDLTINDVVNRIIEIATARDANSPMEESMEQVNTTIGTPQEQASEKAVREESAIPTMEELEKEMSSEYPTIRSGSVVSGTVIEITPSGIYVDLGYKTDGMIPTEEFSEEDGKDFKVGDQIKVLIKSVDDGKGQVRLSFRKARELITWDEIQESFNKQQPIQCTIKDRIKGGYDVSINGIRAFLPQSQLSHGKNAKESIGKTFPMMVTEFDRRRRNVVVSERALTESVRNKYRGELFSKIQPGDTIKGVVSRIVEYGAFVDLGQGVEGLIHRNDLSWSVIANPREIVQPGMEIESKVLKIDNEKGKISLGVKQMKDDPWATVDQRYEPKRKYEGKVKNLMDFGAFVELEEGVEGLVHISDLSWARNVKHPSDVVKSGDTIQVVIKEIDKEKKRISLSYKATLPHPWEAIESRYKIGDVVKGKVTNLTDFGAFVEIDEGVEGLLHVSDMDWVKKINHPKEVLEKNQEIDVKILNIDIHGRRLSLGLKQTTTDPWEVLDQSFRIGDVVTGVVKNIVTYGAFVQLVNGLEGLLHISEFSWESEVKDPGEALKVGDQVTVMIYELDKSKQKIGLSLRRLSDDPWKGIEKRFPIGSVQVGKVIGIQDNGAEVLLGEGVSGMVHVSQISQNRIAHPSEVLKEGDEAVVKIVEIDRKNRRLKLSIKEAVIDNDARELKKYQDASTEGFSDTIGDLLKDKLKSFKEQLKG